MTEHKQYPWIISKCWSQRTAAPRIITGHLVCMCWQAFGPWIPIKPVGFRVDKLKGSSLVILTFLTSMCQEGADFSGEKAKAAS